MSVRRTLATGLAACALLGTTFTPAYAIPEPDMSVITAPVPDGGKPEPAVAMEQKTECSSGGLIDGTPLAAVPPPSVAFQINELHKHATGKGVTVAIIDSGVTPGARLPDVVGGGDYVTGGDGLSDCDRHGTLIAGIIAAQPSDKDKFIGVAPDVELISIRQTSAAFGPVDENDAGKAASTLATLANAIVRSVELGADIINLSVTSCYPAEQAVDTNDLKAAIRYAYDQGVVLVTSAGNSDSEACAANPHYDPNNPRDTRNWGGVKNVSMPSYYTAALLSVGGATLTGQPYTTTMSGPWVDVAAPAVGITSLDPALMDEGGLTNASSTNEGLSEITGTSFAAAYVTGLVALLKEQDPDITPAEVFHTITTTARPGPSNTINTLGHGVVDPVAALTQSGYKESPKDPYMAVPAPTQQPSPDWAAQLTAMIIAAVSALAVAGFVVGTFIRKISSPQNKTKDLNRV